MNPKGRHDQLVTEELPGELLVYDLACNKAHCLNQAAAFVWQRCDGATTVPEIAARLPAELGLPADEALVWLALDRLGQAGLLQDQPAPPAGHKLLGRRDLIRQLGLTGSVAMLMPIVATARIPEAAAAKSHPCKPPNCDCVSDNGFVRCCPELATKAACKECCNGIPNGILHRVAKMDCKALCDDID